jgi:hypothetical protein
MPKGRRFAGVVAAQVLHIWEHLWIAVGPTLELRSLKAVSGSAATLEKV